MTPSRHVRLVKEFCSCLSCHRESAASRESAELGERVTKKLQTRDKENSKAKVAKLRLAKRIYLSPIYFLEKIRGKKKKGPHPIYFQELVRSHRAQVSRALTATITPQKLNSRPQMQPPAAQHGRAA